MKAIVKLLVVLFCVFTTALISGCGKSKPELEAWNVYNGELAAYHVEIDESMRDGIWTRMVHLEPVNGYEKPSPNPFAITGHDNDGDGQFDRVFIRELSVNGYNSVVFTGRGKRIWEPCPADRGKVLPFTDEQVASAQTKLYLAMATVYNQKHVVSTLESFRAKQK